MAMHQQLAQQYQTMLAQQMALQQQMLNQQNNSSGQPAQAPVPQFAMP